MVRIEIRITETRTRIVDSNFHSKNSLVRFGLILDFKKLEIIRFETEIANSKTKNRAGALQYHI